MRARSLCKYQVEYSPVGVVFAVASDFRSGWLSAAPSRNSEHREISQRAPCEPKTNGAPTSQHTLAVSRNDLFVHYWVYGFASFCESIFDRIPRHQAIMQSRIGGSLAINIIYVECGGAAVAVAAGAAAPHSTHARALCSVTVNLYLVKYENVRYISCLMRFHTHWPRSQSVEFISA